MRRFALTTALFIALPAAAQPPAAGPGPAVTFQAASIEKLIDDVKATFKMVAGPNADRAIQNFDKGFNELNQLDGFDLKKLLSGYLILKDKADDTGVVLVLPVTDEAKCLATLGKQSRKPTPVPGNKGLYNLDSDELPAVLLTLLRFHNGHAYLSFNVTEKDLDAATLAAPDKLIDPKETAQFAAKGDVRKLPPVLVDRARVAIDQRLTRWKEDVEGASPSAVNAQRAIDSLVRRQWTAFEKETYMLGWKVRIDPKASSVEQLFTLAVKPGTPFAADIAEWTKPKENRFTGLADKSAAAQVFVKFPVFVPQIRDLAEASFDHFEKQSKDELPEATHAFFSELVAGLKRTAKSGDADFAAVLHGPDDAGTFTAVVALSFDDTSKVETELKTLVKALAPKDIHDAITWDVAKSGGVNLHEMKYDIPLPDAVKRAFGDKSVLILGFGKNTVFAGIGPDARAKVADAALRKPTGPGTGPTILVDAAYNPARILKLVKAVEDRGGEQVALILGTEDAMTHFLRASFTGGQQLTFNLTANLRLYGWWFLGFGPPQPLASQPRRDP